MRALMTAWRSSICAISSAASAATKLSFRARIGLPS
jgi:hypothetical protein